MANGWTIFPALPRRAQTPRRRCCDCRSRCGDWNGIMCRWRSVRESSGWSPGWIGPTRRISHHDRLASRSRCAGRDDRASVAVCSPRPAQRRGAVGRDPPMMRSDQPLDTPIARHVWETRYRAGVAAEPSVQATWRRVAQALADGRAGRSRGMGAAVLRHTAGLPVPARRTHPGRRRHRPRRDAVQLLRHGHRSRIRSPASFARWRKAR